MTEKPRILALGLAALILGACAAPTGSDPTPTTVDQTSITDMSLAATTTTEQVVTRSTDTEVATTVDSTTTTSVAGVDTSEYPESWAQTLIDAANQDDFGLLDSYAFASDEKRDLFRIFVESDLPELALVSQCERSGRGAECWVSFDNTQAYSAFLGGKEEVFLDIQVHSLTSEMVASDGAYGAGCSPGPGPLPDGIWFGFVAALSSDAFDFDLACIYPHPVIDQAPVNTSRTLRSVPVEADVLVREMHETELPWVGTTYSQWRPDACQFDEGCAVWIDIRDGSVIYISEVFFS
jgi:hypothetical protein